MNYLNTYLATYNTYLTAALYPDVPNYSFFYQVVITVVLLVVIGLLIKVIYDRRKLESIVQERTKSLAQEKVLFSTVLDSIPDVLFCKDSDFNLIRINAAYERLFNKKREDIIGKTELEISNLPDEFAESFQEWDRKILKSGITQRIEEEVPDHNGQIRIFETMKTPIVFNEETIGILGVARDITPRKELEQAIINASNAKTAFIANMSHEIRTPMNSIIGFSELALTEEITPVVQQYLTHILENSTGLLQIINDILDVSKMESGKLELESIPFTLQETFDLCQSALLPKAIEKGIKLKFVKDAVLGNTTLLGDPTRLRQVFINLLSNAVKFTEVGTISLTGEVVNTTESTQTILFQVKDSGIGMDEEQIARVLEPFSQADVSVTRRYGGTGLGLSIVKNIVDAMEGSIEIQSVLGIGTNFTFELTFPVVKAKVHKDSKKHGRPQFDAEILVCEDNSMNQLVIKEHLSRIGIKVVIAENGKEAIDIITARKNEKVQMFNLIFMDIHMPVMGGIEAAEAIAKLNISTPIIALTANVMAADREIYLNHGMADYLSKPFVAQDLWDCLLRYLAPKGWN